MKTSNFPHTGYAPVLALAICCSCSVATAQVLAKTKTEAYEFAPREYYKLNDIKLGQVLEKADLIGIAVLDTMNVDTLRPVLRSSFDQISFGDSIAYTPRKVQVHGLWYYVLEGDLLLTEDEYLKYAMTKLIEQQQPAQDQPSDQLIGEVVNGRFLRWPVGHVLRYAVVRPSFSNEEHYRMLVANMKEATKAWEEVCGIKFEHVVARDGTPAIQPTQDLSFIVAEYDAHGAFIARAFFPNYPASRRQILIDPSYYTTSFNLVGVLRHELGHAIGWRHEHISSGAPAACPNELEGPAVAITAYDPKSVMHYFCGGVGSIAMELSEKDKAGARLVYGGPLTP